MGDKQGFLTKEGGSWKSWKKRYFVIKAGSLFYSKNQATGHLGIIELSSATNVLASDYKKKRFCFSIETPKRIYYLCANSDADRNAWVAALADERDRVQEKGKYTPASPTMNGAGQVVQPAKPKTPATIGVEDFDLLRVIGKGSFGKVFMVRKKDNGKIYAMKVLNKKNIILRSEIEHTRTEKDILQKLVHPFLVNLYFSFQSPDKLYDLLFEKDKRFPEPRVKFYAAEIALGLEYLHNSGVIYRDLKPENLLLTEDGHICMTDFGISKQGLMAEDDRTATFCGTPEYLAPEILQGQTYGKGVDWWSYGTLVFEMLTGLPPYYCTDVQQMYTKILTAPLIVPDFISPEGRSLIAGLLEREPSRRLSYDSSYPVNPNHVHCESTYPDDDGKVIKAHPFWKGIDWQRMLEKDIPAPYVPPVKSKEDTGMVSDEFKNQKVEMTYVPSNLSANEQANFAGFTYVSQEAPLKP